MERLIFKNLLKWKNSPTRKPLILKGARQTGKTYLLRELGANHFKQMHYVNFESNNEVARVFEGNLEAANLIDELSLIFNVTINLKEDLLIFDEVQECPRALTSLKYFNEQMPELAVCCAGSHMGLVFSKESFPVGKVEFLSLLPMNFEEFLVADGRESLLDKYNDIKKRKTISDTYHETFVKLFKIFLVTGGLPEVVQMYYSLEKLDLESFQIIRKLQRNLLDSYISDFTKHAGKINSLHIQNTFSSVARQIASCQDGSLQKFKFKDVIRGKTGYRELQGPIEWLKASGLVIEVHLLNRAERPLQAFTKTNKFKLFFFDIGLLGTMLDLSLKELLSLNFGIGKGAFIENFMAQELIASGEQQLYSWSENTSEIDFLRSIDDELVPVEVKSSNKFRARSLEFYIKRYSPSKAQIISLKSPNFDDPKVAKLPLYCPY